MSRISIERAVAGARSLSAWSSTTLLSLALAACGGGGGSDSSPPPQNTPPPAQTPTNAAPVPSVSPVSITLPTDTASWSGTATDDNLPTGAQLSYTWEFVSGPSGPNNTPGAILASTNTKDTSARFVGGPGDYVFNFKVSDTALTGTTQLHVTVNANPNTYPAAPTSSSPGWPTVTPDAEKMNVTLLDQARDYSMTTGNDVQSGYIIRHGNLVYSWGSASQQYEMKSTTKSMGGLALLLALDEGKLALTDKASAKLPVFGTDPSVDTSAAPAGASLADITVLQLATHTAGFSKPDDPTVEPRKLVYAPGTTWFYSDQGLNWLADVLTQTYAQDLTDLMKARVFTTLGITVGPPNTTSGDVVWRDNRFRSTTLTVNGTAIGRRELASGISANVNAMARVGLLMLRQGVWGNTSILSNAIVAKAHTPPPEVASANPPLQVPLSSDYPGATANYGILWWTNTSGQLANVPKDAYWAWGLHETFIIVIPSLDLVVARAGNKGWHYTNNVQQPEAWNADYNVLKPFLEPIVQSISP
jgi:CubicO group peptidase (beta-lactamase class C family)